MPQYTEHTSRGRRRSTRDPLIGTWLDDPLPDRGAHRHRRVCPVYRAHTADGAVVALKVLHPRLTADPAIVARFQREGATLASCATRTPCARSQSARPAMDCRTS